MDEEKNKITLISPHPSRRADMFKIISLCIAVTPSPAGEGFLCLHSCTGLKSQLLADEVYSHFTINKGVRIYGRHAAHAKICGAVVATDEPLCLEFCHDIVIIKNGVLY